MKLQTLRGIKRIWRKSVTTTGGALGAVHKAAVAAPASLLESATEVFSPSTDEDTRAGRMRLSNLACNLALGTAAGTLIAGPAGAVMGLAVSFVGSTLGNVLEEASGHSRDFEETVRNGARKALESGKPGLTGKLKAVLHGAAEGIKGEFHHGHLAGQARTAGFLDGLKYDLISEPRGNPEKPAGLSERLVDAARTGMGIIGSVLSFPGGIVVGSLQALKDPKQDFRPTMKPLVRLCSGLGKAIIPGILGGMLAGPAGAAVATGVGLLFDISIDGINTISDGKEGVNGAMYREIERSLGEALPDQDEAHSGYGLYYRFGKGAAVGAQVSLKEGWKRGFYGGVDTVKSLVESPFRAAEPLEGSTAG